MINQVWNVGGTSTIGTLEHEVGHALRLEHGGDLLHLMHPGLRGGNELTPGEISSLRGSHYAR